MITDPDAHFKLVYVSRKLAPAVALVDPALVETAPSPVIAATAADALAHAVESYVNNGSDPLLDSINIARDQDDRAQPAARRSTCVTPTPSTNWRWRARWRGSPST